MVGTSATVSPARCQRATCCRSAATLRATARLPIFSAFPRVMLHCDVDCPGARGKRYLHEPAGARPDTRCAARSESIES